MKRLHLLSAVCALLICSSVSSLANATLIYNVSRTIGAGTVTGFIETDGTLGILDSSNITNWMLTLTAPNLTGGSPDVIDFSTAKQTKIVGTATTATTTQILFDFDLAGNNYLILQGGGPDNNYWCVETAICSSVGPGEIIANNASALGPAQSVSRSGNLVIAQVVPVPAASWLFLSGLMGLVGWSRRK